LEISPTSVLIHILHVYDNSAFIVTGYELDGQGISFQCLTGTRDFSLLHRVETASEAQAATYTIGIGEGGGSFPGDEEAGRETDQSPLSSTEIQNA
jgi:hypothetical protein